MIDQITSPYVQGVFVTGAIFAIATIGLYVTFASGQISVMHMALVGVGGYASGVASLMWNFPFVASLVAGALAGAVVGLGVSFLVRKMADMVLGVATIAFGQGLALLASNIPAIGGGLGYLGIPLDTTLPVTMITLVLVMAVSVVVLRSSIGMTLIGVGRDPVVSESLGISTMTVKLAAFAVGGGLAGLAGALQAHWLGLVDPTSLGFANEAPLFVFMIIGGSTSVWGCLVGAVCVTWLLEGLRIVGNNRFWIEGLLLTAVVILRPDGLILRGRIRSDGRWLPTWLSLRLPRRPSGSSAAGEGKP